MSDLTITHTYEDGSVLEGDPRPHHKLVKDAGWRFSRNIGVGGGWYIQRSRGKVISPYAQRGLHELADQLRAVGFTVDVEIDNTPVAVAVMEERKEERDDARQERLEGRHGDLDAEAAASYTAARTMGDAIPFGQPMLVDHYSYKRDRSYRERMVAKYDKAFTLMGEARRAARRAAAVEHRRDETVGKIMRRIDTLATEARSLERSIDDPGFDGQPADWREYILVKLAEVTGKLDYWEQVIADREAAGEKVFRQDNLTTGDRVQCSWGWGTVIKPNKKTVKVQFDVDGFAHNTDYSKILDHRPARTVAV